MSLTFVLSMSTALAEEGEKNSPLCASSGLSDADRFFCWQREAKTTDEAVQREYLLLLKELTARPEQLQMLRVAQEAWVNYREATARYYEAARGCAIGQHCLVNNVIYLSAHHSISKDRLKELKAARSQLTVQGFLL